MRPFLFVSTFCLMIQLVADTNTHANTETFVSAVFIQDEIVQGAGVHRELQGQVTGIPFSTTLRTNGKT